MKKSHLLFSISLLVASVAYSQGYNVGDKASDFKLKNVDGNFVSLKDFPDAKGFIVVFTCNHCPYAQAYQDRIIELDKNYKGKGFPVIAISSNDAQIVPDDSYDKMVARAKEKGYTFPYLYDETQEVCMKFGAKRTPQVFVLEKMNSELIVRYIGAIDDNYEDPSKVSATYVTNAVNAVMSGRLPEPSVTKAVGCSIKEKSHQM
jgi:peroxiredoxin